MALQKRDSRAIDTGRVNDIGRIIREIGAAPDCARDLRVIVKAGATRGSLLDLLARAVIAPEGKSLTNRIRAKQLQLRSVAGQIRTVTRHAERLANDSYSYPQFYSPFATKDFENYKDRETRRLASQWPFEAMRKYANWAENEARTFGLLLRRNSQKERNLGILFLLQWVHFQTGRLFERELSRLLTDASEAAGKPRNFTDSNLRKMFGRHALPSTRQRVDI